MHRHGIGVILDWVPAHFPRDEWALARFDGTALYEHADPRRGAHPDWGTLVFNLGRNEVRNFLLANALYWLDEYHADGLRVDAVASMLYLDYSRRPGEWMPNEFGGREDLDAVAFLKELNELVHGREPGTIIGGRGVDGVARRLAARCTSAGSASASSGTWGGCTTRSTTSSTTRSTAAIHHHELTFSLVYAFTENFMLPLSHDEVVHGKGSLLEQDARATAGRSSPTCARSTRYMWAHPGKKLLFMGCEIAQWARVERDELARLAPARARRARGRAVARARPEPDLPRGAGALGGRLRRRRLRVGRAERR